MAVLVACHLLTVPVLLVLAAMTGLIATVDGPATSLLGNDLVPDADVPSAIALGSVVHSVGRLAGTALAGVTLASVGSAGAYVINGASFLFVSAVIPFPQPVRRHAPRAEATANARGHGMGLREGLAFFLTRRLVALAVISAVTAMLGRNYALTLATLVTGPAAYGAVSTVPAVGGTAGAILAGRLRRPTVRLVGALAAAGGLLQVLAGAAPMLLVLLLLVIPMAIVESVSDTAATTVLQTDPPAHLRGRVLGVWNSISTAWGLAGPPALGLLIQTAGARSALIGGGLVIATVIAGGMLARGGLRPTPTPSYATAA